MYCIGTSGAAVYTVQLRREHCCQLSSWFPNQIQKKNSYKSRKILHILICVNMGVSEENILNLTYFSDLVKALSSYFAELSATWQQWPGTGRLRVEWLWW